MDAWSWFLVAVAGGIPLSCVGWYVEHRGDERAGRRVDPEAYSRIETQAAETSLRRQRNDAWTNGF